MSTVDSTNEWETAEKKDGLVQTQHAKIHLAVQGPPRQPGQPVVLIIPGLGSVTSTWFAVVRRLGKDVRTIQFDRAGLGKSDDAPDLRTPAIIAAELSELLQNAPIATPYLVVSQSYGGLIAREFLALCSPGSIAGMIFVDTNQENTHDRMKSPATMNPILTKIDYQAAVGFSPEGRLTPEEAAIIMEDETERAEQTGAKEIATLFESCHALGTKKQLETAPLSPHPVTVIMGDMGRDFQRMAKYAKENGVGSEDERKDFEQWANLIEEVHEGLQREQLQLSENSRFVKACDSGHNVQFWEPQLIADEILLMLRDLSG